MKKILLSVCTLGALFTACSKDSDDDAKIIHTPEKQAYITPQNTNYQGFKNKVEQAKPKMATDIYHVDTKKQVQADFDGWLSQWQDVLKSGADAKPGQAGLLAYQKEGKTTYRVVNGKGVEPEQLIKKGLIGASQFSEALGVIQSSYKNPTANKVEIVNNVIKIYLGSLEQLDKTKVTTENHGVTRESYPIPEGNEFAKYLNAVSADEDFKNYEDDFYNKLREVKQLAANNDKNFALKLLQVLDIPQKVVGIRAVHYFYEGAKDINKLGANLQAGSAHAISEGLGFLYSLQFTYQGSTHQPYYTFDEVKNFISEIDLYQNADKTAQKLQEKAEEIAKKIGVDIAKIIN